jgi:AcrR family transcriptional regulator
MVRKSKKPEERKREILEMAQKMFFSEGYENTSVEKIIKSLDLAKGTFYYYFKSKTDLLEALAELHAEKHYKLWEEIVNKKEWNALEKFNRVFQTSADLKVQDKQLIISYLKNFMDDQNNLMRHKLNMHRMEKIADLLEPIVKQGNNEGVFRTPYPRYSIIMILKLAEGMTDELYPLMIEMIEKGINKEKIIQKYDMLEHMAERILGAREGSVEFFNRSILDHFVLN